MYARPSKSRVENSKEETVFTEHQHENCKGAVDVESYFPTNVINCISKQHVIQVLSCLRINSPGFLILTKVDNYCSLWHQSHLIMSSISTCYSPSVKWSLSLFV